MVTTETIKNETDIFWNDAETEKKLKRYLEQGISKLREYAGKDIEFEEGTSEGALLIDYVLYAYYKKSEYFEQNYKSDLMWLRFKHQEASE